MLLVFDIGNSNIVMGAYDGKKLYRHWRISTDRQKTGDEYGMLINELFRFQGMDMNDIDDIWDQADAAEDDVTWASMRFSAGLLTKQADNNYQDADMEKIQYDQQEAKLVYQAQEMMVSLEQFLKTFI